MVRAQVGLSLLVVLAVAVTPAIVDGQEFIRGDANGDGRISITDALFELNVLFGPEDTVCRSALDVNDDGRTDVADPIYNLQYMFLNGEAPPGPFPDCGTDPTADDIPCDKDLASCGLGGPMDGLTEAELISFERGKALMDKRFTPSEGLGPFYNTTSCSSCHDKPVAGGSSPIYRNFFIVQIGDPGPGQYTPPGQPGPVMPAYNGFDGARPVIPEDPFGPDDDPVRQAQRNAPPFFGLGMFEFISDATIIDNADPNDTDDDGISGRYNVARSFGGVAYLGRFGYKLQANFIEAFIRGAAFNQMGMTTDAVDGADGFVQMALLQQGADPEASTEDDDGVDDPEISVEDFGDIIAFNRFLRPPRPLPFSSDAESGETLFDDIGCTKCHIPSLDSSKGPVNAYTDLLLHNLGSDLADGIHMGTPQDSVLDGPYVTDEFRTQPLWGLRFHGPFLHDGRADTVRDAIVAHEGEAEAIRDEFLDLSDDEQIQILEFLKAL